MFLYIQNGRYHAWQHREEPFLPEQHEQQREALEAEWYTRWASTDNDGMSQLPRYIAEDTAKTMWSNLGRCSESDAHEEAAEYKKTFEQDAQFIFSRVQHHFHNKNEEGIRTIAQRLHQ